MHGWRWKAPQRLRSKALTHPASPWLQAGPIVVDGVVASSHSEWALDGVLEAIAPGALKHLPMVYQVSTDGCSNGLPGTAMWIATLAICSQPYGVWLPFAPGLDAAAAAGVQRAGHAAVERTAGGHPPAGAAAPAGHGAGWNFDSCCAVNLVCFGKLLDSGCARFVRSTNVPEGWGLRTREVLSMAP